MKCSNASVRSALLRIQGGGTPRSETLWHGLIDLRGGSGVIGFPSSRGRHTTESQLATGPRVLGKTLHRHAPLPGFELYEQYLRVRRPDVLSNVSLGGDPHDVAGIELAIAAGSVGEVEATTKGAQCVEH